jgi:serine/threonine protein kinase
MTPTFQLTTRYQVQEPIGKGGAGQVYRAWDTQLNRWVALKRLHGGLNAEDQQEAHIFQEATTMATLQHPNIVTLFDFGADAEGPFVIMELLEGENLDEVVARGVFPLAEFAQLARQALEGLIAAHHVGLIHRDLKPSNVMLTWLPSGAFQVKILDFGLAKFISAPQLQTVHQDGTMLGSVFVMAPEQFNRQPLDERTDLYALGCLLYYTLAGQFPFRGETIQDVMIAHLQHHVENLETIRRDLPAALCRWVMRLLCAEPSHRYGNANEALKVLNEIIGQESTSVVRLPPLSARSHSGGLIMGLVVIALAGGGWWFYQQQGAKPSEPIRTTESAEPRMVSPATKAKTDPISPSPMSENVLEPHDLTQFQQKIGQKVTTVGQVVLTGENKTGTVRYLNFDQDYKKAIALVFFLNQIEAPEEKLQTYVGKEVRVTGEVGEHKGTYQIVIKDWSQIEVR